MDWQLIVPLLIIVPFIIFPAVFIWYLNFRGLYAALRQRKMVRVLAAVSKISRLSFLIAVPLAIYAAAIWFFYGHFGWQVALVTALVMPIVLFVPLLIWVAMASGLWQVSRELLRRRIAAPRRTGRVVAERVIVR